ncbi:MAG: hypothetical protein JKY34_05880 [Kordiimonadaceae bacterium]|nr:hypothetical protein [Kordiimonadaceae bacterium]
MRSYIYFLVFIITSLGNALSARPMTVEGLSQLKEIAGAQISPDGQWVLYTVTITDVQVEAHRASIWRVGLNDKKPVQLPDSLENAYDLIT